MNRPLLRYIEVPREWEFPQFTFGQEVVWETKNDIPVRSVIQGMMYTEGYWQYEVTYDPHLVPESEFDSGNRCVNEMDLQALPEN